MASIFERAMSKKNKDDIGSLQKVVGKSIDDFPLQSPEIDDTARIQRALDYGVSQNKRIVINFPNDKIYKISNKITIDVNFSAMIGQAFVIDASAITSGEALLVVGTKYPTYRNTITVIDGLQLKGHSQAIVDSPTPSEISAGKAKSTIGIKFDGVGSAGASHINLFNTNVYGFGKGLQYNNHAYIITMFNSDVYWCGTCVEMPASLVDYGERITFISCSFYNSDNLIKQSNKDGNMKFTNCSFDYQSYRAFHITGGRVTVIGSHIESKSDLDYWWYVEGAGSLLQLRGCEIVVASEKGNTSAFELGYCDANTDLCGMEIDGCFMSLSNYKKPFLIAGDGRVTVRNLKTNKLDYKFTTSKSNNLLRDGTFKDANSLLDWNTETTDTASIDTTTYYSSPSSLKLNSPSGNGVIINNKIPCSPNELITVSLMVKTQNLVANSKSLYISRRFLDGKDNVLFDATQTISTDIDWTQYVFQDTKVAPAGTQKFMIRINTGATNPACNMWIDELYVTKN